METHLNGAQVFLLPLINSAFRSERAVSFFKLTFIYSALYFFLSQNPLTLNPPARPKKSTNGTG